MANRLRAAVSRVPGCQVQAVTLFVADPSHAEVVREIRSSATGRSVPGDRVQPANGTLKERGGGHEICGPTAERRLKDAFDESHVMNHGQPRHGHPGRATFVKM